jgi:hypothetical protein
MPPRWSLTCLSPVSLSTHRPGRPGPNGSVARVLRPIGPPRLRTPRRPSGPPVGHRLHPPLVAATHEALRLRDLLKFDFFFSRSRDFAAELAAELAIIDPLARTGLHEFTPAEARRWLEQGNPLVAPSSCGRSSTPTTWSPTGSPPATTSRSTSPASSTSASASAGNGQSKAGWRAKSQSPWNCSSPRSAWPGTATSSTRPRRTFASAAPDSATNSARYSGESTSSPTWHN